MMCNMGMDAFMMSGMGCGMMGVRHSVPTRWYLRYAPLVSQPFTELITFVTCCLAKMMSGCFGRVLRFVRLSAESSELCTGGMMPGQMMGMGGAPLRASHFVGGKKHERRVEDAVGWAAAEAFLGAHRVFSVHVLPRLREHRQRGRHNRRWCRWCSWCRRRRWHRCRACFPS